MRGLNVFLRDNTPKTQKNSLGYQRQHPKVQKALTRVVKRQNPKTQKYSPGQQRQHPKAQKNTHQGSKETAPKSTKKHKNTHLGGKDSTQMHKKHKNTHLGRVAKTASKSSKTLTWGVKRQHPSKAQKQSPGQQKREAPQVLNSSPANAEEETR